MSAVIFTRPPRPGISISPPALCPHDVSPIAPPASRTPFAVSLIRWEIPPLCPGGSKRLTLTGVRAHGSGKDPSPVPRPLGKARGAVHPLPPGEGKYGVGRATARDGFFPRPPGEGKYCVGRASARDGFFPRPPGEGKYCVGRATARDGFFPRPLGEGKYCVGRATARDGFFPLPPGEGKYCVGRASARDGFFPLPWGEGGRGTRSGEGSFPDGRGPAPLRGQPP